MIKNLLGKRSRKIGKRGQVTIFIIIGIAIVIIGGLLIVFRDKIPIGNRIGTTQVEPINEYMKNCLEDQLILELKNRNKFGGRDSLDNPSLVFPNYNLLNAPRNILPTISQIERGIENKIELLIKNDECSLEQFRDNFNIEEDKDKLDVQVEIEDNIVNLIVTYPLIINKEDLNVEIDKFTILLDENFVDVWEGANNIINGINSGMSLNTIDYCYGLDVKCVSTDNRNREKIIIIGSEDKFEDDGEIKDGGEVFVFVVRI